MTRTIPVSGKFLIDKKAIQCGFKCKKRSYKMLVPGTLWKQYHIEVGKLMTSELLGPSIKPMCKTKPRLAGLQKNISCTEPHTTWD
jgi:hypothetical protein